MITVPEIDLTDPDVLRDPFTAYGVARERAPLARIGAPGFGPVWTLLRYEDCRAMLADPRFALTPESYQRPPVPADCLPYLHTMQEMEGPEHTRLRRLVAPAFTPRRALDARPRVARIVARLLDDLPTDGPVDVLAHLARPLPIDVISELVGVPEEDREEWRGYGAAVAAGSGPGFIGAIPAIIAAAKATVASRRAQPADDVVSHLLHLSDVEVVTFVWQLVLAGQTPTNLIANAIEALLTHPDQLARLRSDPGLASTAVEELTRWRGPQLLTIPRYATEDVELHGVPIKRGEAVTAAIVSANRDPRVFSDPDRLDLGREGPAHLGYAHGPHFCLGAPLARVETEVALLELLRRCPTLALAEARRQPDPGTWRLTALTVTR